MSNFIIDADKINNLFVSFRKMDVLFERHRKGIDVMDARDIESLKERRWHYKEVIGMLGLFDDYETWLEELGIE